MFCSSWSDSWSLVRYRWNVDPSFFVLRSHCIQSWRRENVIVTRRVAILQYDNCTITKSGYRPKFTPNRINRLLTPFHRPCWESPRPISQRTTSFSRFRIICRYIVCESISINILYSFIVTYGKQTHWPCLKQ